MAQMRSLTDTSILVITDRAALKGILLHVTVSGEAQGDALVSPGGMRFLERKREKGEQRYIGGSRISDCRTTTRSTKSNYVSTESHMTCDIVIIRPGLVRYSSLQWYDKRVVVVSVCRVFSPKRGEDMV